jgi:sirohydrochlorin ferrochelatase
MRALVFVAHGSRVESSNDEVRELAARLAPHLGADFERVIPAFLELASPSIPEGIDAAVTDGASAVEVFPYFLAAGRHVEIDVPALVEEARARHPAVRLELRPYLGALPGLEGLLAAALSSKAR